MKRMHCAPVLAAMLLASPTARLGVAYANSPADSMALVAECEYGITLALEGRLAAAESVFVSLLSHSPMDARALTNLGNLHLLRGDVDLAQSFYAAALEVDPADPGIGLDRSTAFMLAGDEAAAHAEAERAVQAAGGAEQAGALLGLRMESETPAAAKAADQQSLSKAEMRDLLLAATQPLAAAAPPARAASGADSTAAGQPEASSKRATMRRSAAPRSADRSDAAHLLYWKR